MRLLFFMAHPGHARNFESILREASKRGNEVTIAFDRMVKGTQPNVRKLMTTLANEVPGLEVTQAPRPAKSDWPRVGEALRRSLDYLSYIEPASELGGKSRARAAEQAPKPIRGLTSAPGFARTAGRSALRSVLALTEQAVPIHEPVTRFIEEQRPDVVLVTPLIEFGSPQAEYLRAARVLGIPCCLPVASWDNLTSKGLIHELPDRVLVWNETQFAEAVELHGVDPSSIEVCGAWAYDRWHDWKPHWDRDAFCARLGVDPGRPYVLYVGSSSFIAPEEAKFLESWIAALRPRLPDVQFVVRPHPTNPLLDSSAARVALGEAEDVVVYPPWGEEPVDEPSRRDYFDSLHHSAAVVGINTSALIEAAIVDRPLHTVRAPLGYPETQDELRHFHYLLIENGGVVQAATSFEDHAKQLSRSIRDPARAKKTNARFLRSFVRPRGIEKPAASLALDAVEGTAELEPGPASEGTLAQRAVGRSLAYGARAALRRRSGVGGSRPAKQKQARTTDATRSIPDEATRVTRLSRLATDIRQQEKQESTGGTTADTQDRRDAKRSQLMQIAQEIGETGGRKS